ncbi:MAG: hexitol phosphatase HxpB [Sandaracinaceae bacterium]|nr:hexitol phosphatase HxpB [Sandaracinaceae bacterium]
MLRAAIFDMDGLLVDSEPTWRRTEVEVLATVGLALTEAMCEATTGLRIEEVVRHWHAHAPWEGRAARRVAARIVDRMVEHVRERGAPLPGAAAAVEACARAGLRLAVASSSPSERLVAATLERLALADRFEVVVSAERERLGKPHPAVFLTAAERLGVAPTECVIFEDSLNGVLAAKAARAACVAVPCARDRGDPRLSIADRVVASSAEIDEALLASLGHARPPRPARADHPRRARDRAARLLLPRGLRLAGDRGDARLRRALDRRRAAPRRLPARRLRQEHRTGPRRGAARRARAGRALPRRARPRARPRAPAPRRRARAEPARPAPVGRRGRLLRRPRRQRRRPRAPALTDPGSPLAAPAPARVAGAAGGATSYASPVLPAPPPRSRFVAVVEGDQLRSLIDGERAPIARGEGAQGSVVLASRGERGRRGRARARGARHRARGAARRRRALRRRRVVPPTRLSSRRSAPSPRPASTRPS